MANVSNVAKILPKKYYSLNHINQNIMSKKSYTIAIVAVVLLAIVSVLAIYIVIPIFSENPAITENRLLSQSEPIKIFNNTNNNVINKTSNDLVSTNQSQYQFLSAAEDADIVIDIDKKSDQKDYLYKEPYVPIINNQSIIDNTTINEITNLNIQGQQYTKIAVAKNDLTFLSNKLSINEENIAVYDDYLHVIDQVYATKDTIGFVPLSSLSVKVHPLSIDNISALRDYVNYPLQINYVATGRAESKFTPDFKIHLPSKSVVNEILAVGDIMMGRYVGVKINRSGDNTHSFEYVWEQLSKPDLTFAQLETPFSPTDFTSEGMILVSQPDTIAGLVKSGIDIVSISGNHFGDALREGMDYSFKTLTDNNIKYIGAGPDESKAFSDQVIISNGIKYGFINFVNIMPDSYGAEGDIAGTAWVDFNSIIDREKIINSIQKAENNSDILIVGFHWGTEYTPNPTSTQQEIAHLAIDNGADIIVGTHPHVVQADEVYKDKYINYSLGNFIMDQMWSEETQEGVLLYIYTLDNQIISYNLIPTHVLDYSQVEILSKDEGSHILKRIWNASDLLD
jgi:poly-gamma-glutamate synthesis protein (capsule biosynthesis protein)